MGLDGEGEASPPILNESSAYSKAYAGSTGSSAKTMRAPEDKAQGWETIGKKSEVSFSLSTHFSRCHGHSS